MSKTIFLTGGGTAGHVTPNLALIPRLVAAGYRVEYVGSYKGMERWLIEPLDIRYHAISAGKLRRYFDWQNFVDVLRVLLGFIQSLVLMLRYRPALLFSKGGFVTSPVVWAAWIFRVPVVIHESDMTPGLANKLSLPFARRICYSFPETVNYLPVDKAVYTGIPVREALLHGDGDKAREWLQFTEDKPLLLVVGGSLGSEIINRAVRESLEDLLETFNIVHICGAGHTQNTLAPFGGYRQYEYLNEQLRHLLAITDIVISRAGATMLFELLALHKPNLLIPLSRKASRGDQILNAGSFEKQGYSLVLQEEDLNRKTLLKNIRQLYEQRDEYIDRMVKTAEGQSLQLVIDTIEDTITT
ncbi:MAG: undecaprenyldiphospho-muramoylpentapeptide beta-N-acetylglucosaminyltransferase [Gammaproteobacteria bacterium]|nr:undecaprenyldiphospho-muramoylpentapeptide beta-N-acetylglucosaminyltransferase [Gammaproteobacteria bacterium]